ncbi:MAG: class I SAM-dependent methyltransferase [Flavobacteriaceae bacterium]|nr:class I SAM-dependent methyltransferase [Flavobacteriaceae bacterium]
MNKSEKFWNRLSKNYDKQAKDKAYKLIIDKSKKHLKTNDIVLDFGCATGLYSVEFANNVKEVQAFDMSSEMIKIAKDKAKNIQVNNISFTQTTLFDERYKEGSFDTILALNILLYFEDMDKVLNRMSKLLKPNGLIITSTACLKERRTIIGVLSSSIILILKKIKILPYLKYYTIRELEETISNSRFKIIETDILIDNPATEYYVVAQKVNK